MNNRREVKTAMVTGASGFIASWVVRKLLVQGIEVHGTVRDIENKDKTAHLEEMGDKLPGTLKLFEADLLREGSFDEAALGCDTIFHMASPFVPFKVKDPQRELVEPAVLGTRNVLQAAQKNESVERVVLTSSVASIMGDPTDKVAYSGNRPIFSEEDWNNSSSLKHQPYSYSKVSAEREAWSIAEGQGRWKLVVINPGFVLGPTLSTRTDSTSTGMVTQFLDGAFKRGVPDISFGIVDVRDVAEAHVRAALYEEAEGRNIVSGPVMSLPDINGIIKNLFPDRFVLPAGKIPKALLYVFGPFQGFSWKYIRENGGRSFELLSTKSRESLEMQYRAPEKTLQDQIERLLEAGLVEG